MRWIKKSLDIGDKVIINYPDKTKIATIEDKEGDNILVSIDGIGTKWVTDDMIFEDDGFQCTCDEILKKIEKEKSSIVKSIDNIISILEETKEEGKDFSSIKEKTMGFAEIVNDEWSKIYNTIPNEKINQDTDEKIKEVIEDEIETYR